MPLTIDYILQTLSIVLLYYVGFLASTHLLGIFTLYKLFFYTPLWPVVLLYLSWTYLIEWKTPERGGRDLLINFARRLSVFKYMRDYFPINLVKTSDLDPQKNYIFGYHPHGALTEGASIGLNTEACGFSEKFPGIIPHLSAHSVVTINLGVKSVSLDQWLSGLRTAPRRILTALLYRDIVLALGVIDVTRDSLEYNLTQKGAGHSVVIIVGGQAEIREMGFDSYVLIMSRRKGFIKLALQLGCDLVPVFAFGQNNLYHHFIGGSSCTRYSRPQLWFRNFTSCLGTCFLPGRSPINVVVGSPISVSKIECPTQEDIDKLHERYIDELKGLYEKYKDKYHPSERSELLIV
ncbi:hypothetical protein pdam_00000955 [Pocillopora damicornis]|uniref:Acyltransferase n=1 Tax=Pocillopora damicornis TaxID=46731 RepID=A0A3M6T604_POCDA|nr:hypothetical protein pdam_00000955 [Pocillopora damicornis]